MKEGALISINDVHQLSVACEHNWLLIYPACKYGSCSSLLLLFLSVHAGCNSAQKCSF